MKMGRATPEDDNSVVAHHFLISKSIIMKYYTAHLGERLLTLIGVIVLLSLITFSVSTCTQTQSEIAAPAQALSIRKQVTTMDNAQALIIQPGDTIYRPIAWGAELRVVPNVIYQGNHRKYGWYWFCKTMAYSVVKPANYQQGSIRERVAFADSTLITNADTFYICRRVIY